MKFTSITTTLVGVLFCCAALVHADPPAGVGPADVYTDPDVSWWVAWVDVSGQSLPALPGGYGYVLVQLDDVHLVVPNNPHGNAQLRAHGRLPLGESVMAWDVFGNKLVFATLADMDAACSALAPVFPEACRGDNAMVILNYDTTGLTCALGGVQSERWRTATTRNGITNSLCHVRP